MRQLIVVLKHPRSVPSFLAFAKHVAAMMGKSPYFPVPTVPLATLLAHVADLDAAQVVVKSGLHGAAAERNAKRFVVDGDLEQLRAYVQTIARAYPADEAEAVVASAGMLVKQSSGPSKRDFAVKAGPNSGSVRLEVRHPGIVAAFYWQSSTDGEHWTDHAETVHARTDIANLVPGTRYFFRYSTLTRDGRSDWSDAIAFLVT